MFYYLNGVLSVKEFNLIVIDCGGVGYKCFTTDSTLKKLPQIGSNVKIFTYLYFREDICDLYGFFDMEELNLFKMLISISGVGPKAAVSILSELSFQQFALSVVTNDITLLTRAQGIGKKLAQRIILELKDKLKDQEVDVSEFSDTMIADAGEGTSVSEARSALMVLGYSRNEAGRVLKQIDMSNLTLEDTIREALKLLIS